MNNKMSAEYFRQKADQVSYILERNAEAEARNIFENDILPAIEAEALKGNYFTTYWLSTATSTRVLNEIKRTLYDLGYKINTRIGQDIGIDITWRNR